MKKQPQFTIEITDNVSGEKTKFETEVAMVSFLSEVAGSQGFLVAMYNLEPRHLEAMIDSFKYLMETQDIDEVQKGNTEMLDDLIRANVDDLCDNPNCLSCRTIEKLRSLNVSEDEEDHDDEFKEPTEL